MPTVNYNIKSKEKSAKLYLRFTNTRQLDTFVPLNIFVEVSEWDKKKQCLKNANINPINAKINSKLSNLKTHILDSFNLDYMDGIIIDKDWVKNTINKFFNRPLEETNKEYKIYLSVFAQWWLDNKAEQWRVSSKAFMSRKIKSQYQSSLDIFQKFEQEKGRVKLREITEKDLNNFVSFLEDKDYQYQTVKRFVNRIKFFCARAEEENININKAYKSKLFISKPEEIKEPYLNEDEIQKVYDYDFSYSDRLDNARDNFIIGLWTGLRVSDFLYNLSILNINNDYIDIQTQKTKTFVSIPLHPMVKSILEKRNGQLPRKISDVKFNKYIKEICFIVGIDNEIKGKLVETIKQKGSKKSIKRKKVGYYAKHKLVSSHICRRSFATNLYGKVSNQTLMKICGWSEEKMLLNYIKKSNREHAEQLKKHWETKI